VVAGNYYYGEIVSCRSPFMSSLIPNEKKNLATDHHSMGGKYIRISSLLQREPRDTIPYKVMINYNYRKKKKKKKIK
jgi:hypothetical protein